MLTTIVKCVCPLGVLFPVVHPTSPPQLWFWVNHYLNYILALQPYELFTIGCRSESYHITNGEFCMTSIYKILTDTMPKTNHLTIHTWRKQFWWSVRHITTIHLGSAELRTNLPTFPNSLNQLRANGPGQT